MFQRWNLFYLVPILGLLPLLFLQGVKLWNLPHFQFFPIATGFALWQLLRGAEVKPVSSWRFGIGGAFCCIGAVIAICALWFFRPFLSHVSAVAILIGWALLTIGNESWARIFGISTLLIICIPLPYNLDQSLIQILQSQSSIVCENVLDAFQVEHFRNGNVVQLPTKQLFVDEACSGIDSLYALASVALGMLIYQRAPFLPSLTTMMTVPFWAIMGNLIRLLIIAFGIQWVGADLSEGWQHQALGLFVFVIVSCCHLATAHSFRLLLHPVNVDQGESHVHALYNWLANWPGLFSPKRSTTDLQHQVSRVAKWIFLAIGLACLALGIFATIVVPLEYRLASTPVLPKAFAELLPAEDSMPEIFHGWKRIKYQNNVREELSMFGMYSHTWTYSHAGKQPIVVSLDFPYWHFHDLEICYKSTGWRMLTEEFHAIVTYNENMANAASLKRLTMVRGNWTSGAVWYSNFDLDGKTLALTSDYFNPRRVTLLDRFELSRYKQIPGKQMRLQLQLFVERDSELQDSELDEFERLFGLFLAEILEKSRPAREAIRNAF